MTGLCLGVVLTVAASVLGQGQDDADCQPRPGEQRLRLSACCDMQGFGTDALKGLIDKCEERYPEQTRASRACVYECLFAEWKLVTGGNTLDEEAIGRMAVAGAVEAEPAHAAALEAATAACLASYRGQIDAGGECTSGAHEFLRCMSRQLFWNCPASAWTASAECEALRATVDKCPAMSDAD